MSLRNQLLGVLLSLIAAILVAIGWVSIQGTRAYLEQQLASHAQDAATALSVTLSQSIGKGDTVLAEAQVVSMFDRGYFKRIEVFGPDKSPVLKRELPQRVQGGARGQARAHRCDHRTIAPAPHNSTCT